MLKFLKEKRLIIIVVFLILLPLLFLSSGSKSRHEMAWYERVVYFLTNPIQKVITNSVEGAFHAFDYYINILDTKQKNQTLEKKVSSLLQELSQLRETQLENERLRLLLNFKQRVSPFMVPAQVIAKDISNEFETVQINKGSEDNVKINMAVVTPQGIVGRIIKVTSHYSTVLTVIDPASRIDAVIQRTRARGVISGIAGAHGVMEYVRRTEDVQEGDVVISSGLAGIYPKGLQIGTVYKIIKKPYGISQYVEIKPTVSFSKLEEVFIVMSLEPLPQKKEN
ncbi:MAG: rod shape-determining protein MreC [Deltaproteobacteria bacterium]|nr:rod shape-determining protein MreC [Deltaproteobacteria bacterium]